MDIENTARLPRKIKRALNQYHRSAELGRKKEKARRRPGIAENYVDTGWLLNANSAIARGKYRSRRAEEPKSRSRLHFPVIRVNFRSLAIKRSYTGPSDAPAEENTVGSCARTMQNIGLVKLQFSAAHCARDNGASRLWVGLLSC
jgi:hypothetical protein